MWFWLTLSLFLALALLMWAMEGRIQKWQQDRAIRKRLERLIKTNWKHGW